MVDIQINDKYKVTSDPRQYIVHQRYSKKEQPDEEDQEASNDDYRAIAWFHSFEAMCDFLVDRLSKESGAKSLKALTEEYKKNARLLKNL